MTQARRGLFSAARNKELRSVKEMAKCRKNQRIVLSVIVIGGAIGLCATGLLGEGLKGSAHDLTSYQWLPDGYKCLPCHTAQATFNHELSTETYTVSSSPTLDATDLGQPGGTSAECLSCHDGTVPLDSIGSNEGSDYMTGSAVFGTDLRHHHPVSFTYNSALAARDGTLNDPLTTPSGLGGVIAQDMLSANSKVECNTCHDQHGYGGFDKFLVKPFEGAVLCQTCHKASGSPEAHHIPGRHDPWNNCVLCHGDDLTSGMGPTCMNCHNDFAFPDPPEPGHHMPNRTDPLDSGNCALCHGADLTGSAGPSCYTCHDQMWSDPGSAPVADADGADLAEVSVPDDFDAPAVVDVVDAPAVADVGDVADEIGEETAPPQVGAWDVRIPYLPAQFTVDFEEFDSIRSVRATYPGGEVSFGIGMEYDGMIFWMDASGAIFFGNINHAAGTMRGVVFDYSGGSSIWFAERSPIEKSPWQ